jgi:type II secretory pathway pseudopilin PulG
MMKKIFLNQAGQMLVELMMAIGLAAVIIPSLLTGLIASREGRPQQQQRAQAIALLKETVSAVQSVKDTDWNIFTTAVTDNPYHPVITSNKWTLATGSSTTNNLTQQVVISDVHRDTNGAIVTTGGTLDPSTKKVISTISWTEPQNSSISSTQYLTRTTNLSYSHTTAAVLNSGVPLDTQVTNTAGGEIKLANNNRAKWCSPVFSLDAGGNEVTITLPDGPPVAVAATASTTSVAIPNDVYVATAPNQSSSIKLAYVNVTANTAIPEATLRGTFTLDTVQYSAGTYPSGLGTLTNSFKTNDVKYYTSASGKRYALLATDDPNHEVVVVQINNGSGDAYQDPVNKIYKYWTFFNTKITPSAGTNDQSPYGYGATSLAVFGTRGYVASGGYLYAFDLSNIDTATKTTSLPMLGCRIQIDGYDCQPGSPAAHSKKYSSGQTGTSFSDTGSPAVNDCSDGGNIELHADNDIFPATNGSSTYIYIAVGGGADDELNSVNVTTPSTSGGNSCGRTSSTTNSWKRRGSLDFNSERDTQEAANSVFANASGNRAYISSNGGIDANHDGDPDSKQFYIINTSNPANLSFLEGDSGGPTSGFYYGSGANAQLYPRRSLTVLNGDRAVLVGKDGTSDGNDALEYQVLHTETEATPTYCGGLNFNQGFNDLTSVSELDNDNYVYMVTNTSDHQLKIIEGGPDSALFVSNGTYESPAFDTASIDGSLALRAYNRILANVVQPTNTSIQLQVAIAPAVGGGCSGSTYNYIGPDGTASTKYTVTGTTITGLTPLLSVGNYQNPGRCFRYKLFLSTTDQMVTPELDDITWNYSQ